jgi:hypothetical protein
MLPGYGHVLLARFIIIPKAQVITRFKIIEAMQFFSYRRVSNINEITMLTLNKDETILDEQHSR